MTCWHGSNMRKSRQFPKKSVFGALSLELCTVLKILQQADHLSQKTFIEDVSIDKQFKGNNVATTSQIKQQPAQNFDTNNTKPNQR